MNSRDTLLLFRALLALVIRLDIRDAPLFMDLAHRIGELQETARVEAKT